MLDVNVCTMTLYPTRSKYSTHNAVYFSTVLLGYWH